MEPKELDIAQAYTYVTNYAKQMPQYNKPDKQEELSLFEQAQQGSIEARNKLIVINQRLVPFVLKKNPYILTEANEQGIIDDILQMGYFGIIRSIQKFDPYKGASGPYMARWIKARQQGYLDGIQTDYHHADLIRIPHDFYGYFKVKRHAAYLRRTQLVNNPDRPDMIEVSDRISSKDIDQYFEHVRTYTQLESTPEAFQVEDPEADVFEDIIDKIDNQRRWAELEPWIPPRTILLLSLKNGVGTDYHTYKELRDVIGLSTARIRQIIDNRKPNLEEGIMAKNPYYGLKRGNKDQPYNPHYDYEKNWYGDPEKLCKLELPKKADIREHNRLIFESNPKGYVFSGYPITWLPKKLQVYARSIKKSR